MAWPPGSSDSSTMKSTLDWKEQRLLWAVPGHGWTQWLQRRKGIFIGGTRYKGRTLTGKKESKPSRKPNPSFCSQPSYTDRSPSQHWRSHYLRSVPREQSHTRKRVVRNNQSRLAKQRAQPSVGISWQSITATSAAPSVHAEPKTENHESNHRYRRKARGKKQDRRAAGGGLRWESVCLQLRGYGTNT